MSDAPFTQEQENRLQHIKNQAQHLVAEARALGIALRIDRVPMAPLTMGHARSRVDAWIIREPATDFAAGDRAYDNHYHKIRADMGRDEWLTLWAQGKTPHQLAAAPADAGPRWNEAV